MRDTRASNARPSANYGPRSDDLTIDACITELDPVVWVLTRNAHLPLDVSLGTSGLGIRVRHLGMDRLETIPRQRPMFVVIDALDPPRMSESELLLLLSGTPAPTVLWGDECEWAARTQQLSDLWGVELISVDRSSGLSPVLDLIRSRLP